MRTLDNTRIFQEGNGLSNRSTQINSKIQSYLNIPGITPMLGMTVGDVIDEAAIKYGDNEAFVAPFQNIRKTFRQLKSDVDNLAIGLLSLGLKKGDRLGIWSPNTYECYLTQLAGWKAGLVVVCINAALQSRELLYALNKVGVRCIFISKQFRNQNFYEILTKSIPEIIKSCDEPLKSPHAPELEFVISVEENLTGTLHFNDILEIGSNNILSQLNQCNVQFDDVCTLFFTSGTTGTPKAVMLSHHNLVNNGYFVGKRIELQQNDKICLPVPLFHVYGCQIGIFASLLHGCTCILPSYGYDAVVITEVLANEKCSYIAGTPTMFADILKINESKKFDLSSLKTAVTGGAICSSQLVHDMKNKLELKFIFSNYGMTEIGCTFLSLSNDSDELTSTTVGVPIQNVEIKVVDRQGNIVAIGEEGELLVRSYSVTLGYWGEPEKTSEVLEMSRWFHTGDLFTLTKEGYGQVVGRIKEMVNRGGENVYPKEVEDFLSTHPKISESQVFGVPDVRMGEEPAVWIKLKQGQVMTVEDVKLFCRGQISHYKIPKYIFFKEDFPRTPLGKVMKFRMREETISVLRKV